MHPVDVLERGHKAVMRAIKDLPEEAWLMPDVCGHWSVKDIIAHLASLEKALIEVFGVARGDPMGSLLIELTRDNRQFNNTRVEMRVGYAVADVLAEYEAAWAEAVGLAAALPPSLTINTGFLPAFGMQYDLEDILVFFYYGHKREHAAQIVAWRERMRL